MKILVRNLSRELLRSELLDLFKKFGTVETCDLVLDQKTGKSKGFGFIEMPVEEEAKAAIAKLNATLVKGSKIRVKRTHSR